MGEDGFWPISPDVAIEVKCTSDDGPVTVARFHMIVEHGSTDAVAAHRDARRLVPSGTPPPGLIFDFDAIIDA